MGFGNQLSIMGQAVAGFLGLAQVPTDPALREQRVTELYEQARIEFPGVAEVRATTLVGAPDEVVLVDVRTPRERAVSMVPGAITSEVVEADPSAFVGKHLVAYCTIGYRSGLWAQEWSGRGLQVGNLAGGVLAWSWAGGAFVDAGAGPTHEVHVYGANWDLLAPDYTSTW